MAGNSGFANASIMAGAGQAVQGVAGAYSAYQMGKIAGYRAQYMGVIARIQERQAVDLGESKKQRRRRKLRGDAADYLVRRGASGVRVGGGSDRDVLHAMAFQERTEEAEIDDDTASRIWSLEVGASNVLAGAKAEQTASRVQALSSLISGAGSVVHTAHNYIQNTPPPATPPTTQAAAPTKA